MWMCLYINYSLFFLLKLWTTHLYSVHLIDAFQAVNPVTLVPPRAPNAPLTRIHPDTSQSVYHAENCRKLTDQGPPVQRTVVSFSYPLWTSALTRVEPLTCMLHYLRILDSSDSALVWHLLTYWQIVWQLSSFFHLLFQTLVGVEHVLQCSTDRSLKRLSYCRSRSADWNK